MLPYMEQQTSGERIIYIENGTITATVKPGRLPTATKAVHRFQYCTNGFSIGTPDEYLGQEWIIDNRWYHWSTANAKTKFTP